MISFNELMVIHKKSGIDETYAKLIVPITDPWREGKLDDIIEFVRKWNKRVSVGKNKEKIKKAICELREKIKYFQDSSLEDLKFSGENKNRVKEIFEELAGIKFRIAGKTKFGSRRKRRFGAVGTSKLLHGINPNLFVMWDQGICEHYGCYLNAAGYVLFLKESQKVAMAILNGKDKKNIKEQSGVGVPKLIDEYNWSIWSTAKMKRKK